jgi:DNA-binding MarR family transcriptional regulator
MRGRGSLAKKKKQKASDTEGAQDRGWSDTGELLGFGVRVFNDRATRKIQVYGHTSVRVSHFALVRNMDPDGTRITVLARRAGMTKQAMGQLVRELTLLGYVELWQDRTDRRAKLVTYTEKGRRLAGDAAQVLADVHAEFKRALGKGGMKDLRKLLSKLADKFTAS